MVKIEKTLRERVGFNIKYICWQRGYTMKKLSEISGLPQSYISKVTRGHTNSTLDYLEKIANALEVDVAVFFNKV